MESELLLEVVVAHILQLLQRLHFLFLALHPLYHPMEVGVVVVEALL